MRIRPHPRLQNVAVGDEVYSTSSRLLARVAEIFPAAVCVKIGTLTLHRYPELILSPQLWRAEEIENLSVCRHCGSRHNLILEPDTEVPFRVCANCDKRRGASDKRTLSDDRQWITDD